MKKIKIYAGYHELYITDKVMPFPYGLMKEFDSVEDAEVYAMRRDDFQLLDRDLLPDSICCIDEDSDDYNTYTFDYNELMASWN